jgi:hypothetical protein
MGNFSHLPLQKAIYQKLTGDASLMALVTGIYDRLPQHTDFPYIAIGESSGSDWSTKTTSGADQNLTLHIWSREGGRKEAAAIMERIHALLHDQAMTIEGQALVMSRFISSNILLDDDGWTYQGIMRFRVLSEIN